MPLTGDQNRFVQEQSLFRYVIRDPEVDPGVLRRVLRGEGELLKRSWKSETRRAGPWIVKHSLHSWGRGPLRHALRARRYRAAWLAACRLSECGVGVARPLAFVERRVSRMVLGNTMVSEFLEGCCTVEQYADSMHERNAPGVEAADFLLRLADAVNKLIAAGAWHADLSGKNILTDGAAFFFVDLDAVTLDRAYTPGMRLRNQVQLYDSFCDRWSEELMRPFMQRLGPPPESSVDDWHEKVRKGQLVRRRRHIARWKRQARLP
jgi:tRNA A-37 threonylcarbamoyl transferase component Bud32